MNNNLLVNYEYRGARYIGITKGEGIVCVDQHSGYSSDRHPFLSAALRNEYLSVAANNDIDHELQDVTLLPPVEHSQRVICVGLNYGKHVQETGRSHGDYPVLFTRFASTQVGHGQPLLVPEQSDELDFEGELALVIGKGGRRISQQQAFEHIAGYSCYNDATVRDWQFHTHQYTAGKNFPATGGFGPGLMPVECVPELAQLEIRTELNGVVVQQAKLGEMLFPVERIIEYVSAFTDLSPGDVIVTGTPGGVGFKREPKLFMKDGDTVSVSVSGIGELVNPVRKEQL
ncbi:fumarylacetoacetate hydrolase family protein [Aliamphritea hakodatensis]|uniref:fumarylacetoacetate hydrolase family protein n=1 Tax=Aliamphritea hakodatensis TaxID=2895352 RepID=UPI0022FD58DD|nr:fumarylacetoacetate hydrolase family protein [Aliamphritea hakodatensis]